MTIFLSRRPNLDPEPWECPSCGVRGADPAVLREFDGVKPVWSPRTEFEPTRDPEPWAGVHSGLRASERYDGSYWSPRREEYDRPVNPILADFRENRIQNARAWADVLATGEDWDRDSVRPKGTPAEIDHARKVLTRLANLTGEGK